MRYQDFIESKRKDAQFYGFDTDDINSILFPYQRDVVRWAVKLGRAAIFQDCGMGKTLQQLEWSRIILSKTGGSALILAPLAVSSQTAREADKLNLSVTICKTADDVRQGVNITNYEKLHHFSPDQFSAIVLDESSILKSFSGKVRQEIQSFAERIYYRLACTATPAPNDIMEIGTHSEFLGQMRRVEMLSEYFVHDGGDTQKWRIKGHAEEAFWAWMASWCVAMRKPSDLGYSDDGFILPELTINHRLVDSPPPDGYLFSIEAQSLDERRSARRASMANRVMAAADIANSSADQVLVWCDLNDESHALAKAIDGSVEVTGSDDPEKKEQALFQFASGKIKALVSKPSICGFGMNFQNCNRMIFVGLSDSYEQLYQAIRRCWRFGQKKPVVAHIITSEAESAVVANIERKERQAEMMFDSLVRHISVYSKTRETPKKEYKPEIRMILPTWIGGQSA